LVLALATLLLHLDLALPLASGLPGYCGAPPVDVAAAQAPPGMSLRLLLVTTRHGDRTPIKLYPGGPGENQVEWRCHNLTLLSGVDTGTPPPSILFRKRYMDGRQVLRGDCLFGQLTPKGGAQHRDLGLSLRQLYVDKYAFLRPEFNGKEIWLRSTDVPRTIASAQNLLSGMYPPPSGTGIEWPVFDLHLVDAETDNMTPNTNLCPRLGLLYQALMQSPGWAKHLRELAPLEDKIRFLFHLPANATIDINGIFDQTIARICHNQYIPEGIVPLEGVIASNARFETAFFYNRTFADTLALTIGSFVDEQVARLEQAVNGLAKDLKFVLYSGHDTTLWPLSFAYGFGDMDMDWPPYASHMEIELWQSNSSPFDYFVRFYYNGQPVNTLGCLAPGPCPWATFRRAVAQVIPNNFQKQCGMEQL